MADTKFIIAFVLITSLMVTMLSTQMCGMFTTANEEGPIRYLYDLSTFDLASDSCQIGQNNQIETTSSLISSNFSNVTSQLSTPTSGVTGAFGVSVFIDALKLIFSLVTFLLGLPIYTFFFLIGLPYAVATVLSSFLFLMYVIGWMEFLRGGSL